MSGREGCAECGGVGSGCRCEREEVCDYCNGERRVLTVENEHGDNFSGDTEPCPECRSHWGVRPTPKYVEVCSMCGQRWEGHTRYDEEGEPLQVDLTDCIRMLKNANRGPVGPVGPQGPQGFPGVVPS